MLESQAEDELNTRSVLVFTQNPPVFSPRRGQSRSLRRRVLRQLSQHEASMRLSLKDPVGRGHGPLGLRKERDRAVGGACASVLGVLKS